MPEDQGLFFWIRVLRRRFRFILGCSLAAGIVSLAVGFLLPRWYEARTTILPPHEAQQSLSPRKGDLTSALMLKTLLPYSEGVSLSEVYMAILESDTVARRLIDRFDLQEAYKTKTMVKTLGAFRRRARVAPTYRRVIEVRVEDKDPQRAADIANAFVQELDDLLHRTRSSAGKRQREFLESRVRETRDSLNAADSSLTAIQEAEGVTTMSRNLQEAAEAAGDLLGRQLALTIQLRMLDEAGIRNSPARDQLVLELAAVEKELKKMPVIGLEVARRLRDLKMQEALYEQLNQQLEIARIEEARNTPNVDVLDEAVPPDRHKRPRKGMGAMAGAVAGFVLAISWAALKETRG